MHSDDDNPKPLTPAEARLQSDWLLGALDYPDSGPVADNYFREGFALIRRLDDTEKICSVLNSYLPRVRDEQLRSEIQTFLTSLENTCGTK